MLGAAEINMRTWDIFCRVIDNHGDVGVCWRLARQLANEYPLKVRLWVDDIAALKHIWPAALLVETQILNKVQVYLWQDEFHTDTTANVVIEAFACHIPESYIAQMKQADQPAYWLNLEYLSAETWVEGCHALNSTHPQSGLNKTFFFPGFTPKTGGLLRESELFTARDHFLASRQKTSFLAKLGVVQPPDNALIISLFSYENLAVASLLNAWSQSLVPVIGLIPIGKTLTSINSALHLNLNSGDAFQQGALTLKALPFLTQTEYDALLWACDINFVRGEDSFVRAQWAAKPFIWHIYPQDDAAHLPKLHAFLEKYTLNLAPNLTQTLQQLWLAWNLEKDCYAAWQQLIPHLPQHQAHAQRWCESLASRKDLAASLVHFCQKNL
jgi:uncharacterized repeat protein (TIGR03837 family)